MKFLLLIAIFIGCNQKTETRRIVATKNKEIKPADVKKLTMPSVEMDHGFIMAETITTVRVKNKTSFKRMQWFHVSVPFPMGRVLTKQGLYNYGPGHGLIDWEPLKWHFRDGKKHSVAIGGLKTVVLLEGNQEVNIPIKRQNFKSPLPWNFGPNLTAVIKNDLNGYIFAVAKLKGDNKQYIATLVNNMVALRDGPHHKAYRFRTQFKNKGEPIALSFSAYLDVFNRQDFGEAVIQIGNNTFERPISGGIELDYVDLYYLAPFKLSLRRGDLYGAGNPETIGNGYEKIRLFKDQTIVDGSARSFRGNWSAVFNPKSLTGRSADSQLKDPLFGMASKRSWEVSKAAGIVGTVAPLRTDVKSLRRYYEARYTPDYKVKLYDPSPILNVVPSSSGDQPSFSSNMPYEQQYAIQTQSAQMLQYLLHGILAEEFRPSHWWMNNKRMDIDDIPKTCFAWSGRWHWYSAHNKGHCDQVLPHTEGVNGFKLGYSPWKSADDQHSGVPQLRAVYEMTGDSWAGDLIEYRQSLQVWNKLGEYSWQIFNRTGAERSIRLLEDSLQLYLLKPDTMAGKYLIERLKIGVGTYADGKRSNSFPYDSWGVRDYIKRYGVAGLEHVFNDMRYPDCMGTTPGATPTEDNVCNVAWQSGFYMGFNAAMYRHGFETKITKEMIHAYMDSKQFYFRESGRAYKAKRINNPNYAPLELKSFTQSWFSGWIDAVNNAGKDHKDYPWFRDVLLPYFYKNAFNPGRPNDLHSNNDKWYQ